jgi:YihY family inner membrane protein
VSSAIRVPETFGLDGDDARETLADVGKKKLLKDAFVRLRAADGTSHARSLAFMVSLCLVQGLIVLLGVAASLASVGLTTAVADNISGAVPGPAGSLLTETVEQARRLHERHEFVPLLMAVAGLLATATFAMGQVERGLNRIYGVERDRPAAAKYKRALYLALTVGPLFAVALLFIGFAPDPDSPTGGILATVWIYGRWLLAFALVVAALGLLLRFSPNRHQPGRAWLTFGALTGVLLWVAATVLLALGFRLASTFPQTYGSLAGVVALLLWGYLSALAIFYGVAVAAQLEAERTVRREIAALADDPPRVTAARPNPPQLIDQPGWPSRGRTNSVRR